MHLKRVEEERLTSVLFFDTDIRIEQYLRTLIMADPFLHRNVIDGNEASAGSVSMGTKHEL